MSLISKSTRAREQTPANTPHAQYTLNIEINIPTKKVFKRTFKINLTYDNFSDLINKISQTTQEALAKANQENPKLTYKSFQFTIKNLRNDIFIENTTKLGKNIKNIQPLITQTYLAIGTYTHPKLQEDLLRLHDNKKKMWQEVSAKLQDVSTSSQKQEVYAMLQDTYPSLKPFHLNEITAINKDALIKNIVKLGRYNINFIDQVINIVITIK